jgi:hypothetical protein
VVGFFFRALMVEPEKMQDTMDEQQYYFFL